MYFGTVNNLSGVGFVDTIPFCMLENCKVGQF